MKRAALLSAIAALCCGWASAQPETPRVRESHDEAAVERPNAKKPNINNLIDHGGPVLSSSNTYAVYWGDQTAFPPDLKTGMASLLGGFNGSAYMGIGTQYMRGAQISTTYSATPLVDSSNPPSHAPSTATLGAEIVKLVGTPDPNGIYIIFTSNAPKINYCAFHDKATTADGLTTFQVAYVPNQALLPGCSPYTAQNLHCNTYSDGTVSSFDSVAHEFMEAVTDPHIDAWYDQTGQEIADKCNYNYQGCVSLSTGSFQIQSLWSNAISGCQQQLSAAPNTPVGSAGRQ